MDLYFQFGHGMMDLCRNLIRAWESGTVILSPRDLNGEQILRFANDIKRINGRLLLDPQLYEPRANHHRLTQHDYWPVDYDTNIFLGGLGLRNLLVGLRKLNDAAQTDAYIIPGLYCDRFDDDWLTFQQSIIDESSNVFNGKPQLATICLSGETLRNEEQIEMLLNCSESWDVEGYYVVPERPHGQYLVDDPLWLTNLLVLCSGLKLQKRQVIVGYCNHQMLCLASANVDALASGTWLNVRTFSTAKFIEAADDNKSRRAKWYYCPHALSEFKLAFLDMGHRAGIIETMRPDPAIGSNYADILFTGALPTSTNYSETESFRHYLQCLHTQCLNARGDSFRKTIDNHNLILTTAEGFLNQFHECGVRGQDRDFANYIDVNRSAIAGLVRSRGFVLDRQW
ncbi:MAG: hypothetical protein GX137_07150 [Thermoplasmatales archaeon]|jgi:hypothetical protein|nr:hypothetical protein [Thermoplasmatales archaeon]